MPHKKEASNRRPPQGDAKGREAPEDLRSPVDEAPAEGGDLVARGIRQWQRERPDIDSSGKSVVGRLLRLEEVVLRTLNQVLEPFGMKYQEYAVLATLRVAGASYRLSPSRLQSTLLFTSGGLSNLLKRLEKEGWIKRSIDPNDGRGVLVKLTAKGIRLADEAMPRHAAAELHLLRMFDDGQRDVLSGLLSQMMTGNAPELGPEPGEALRKPRD
ncbi:MarR family winged helix-turn-helix transcriptional regulator [Variovorax sp. E3]|uniref:MarR family winged helix-turn-helix transcriptional regulator n=1 Tax=Variovorax sp. E3 TaxID=1914993 RepID=UPI0018DB03B6|nr:MarR family transcriptional regulator [Variovorax sp. E3]